jgi:hypothetical protein
VEQDRVPHPASEDLLCKRFVKLSSFPDVPQQEVRVRRKSCDAASLCSFSVSVGANTD